MAATAHGGHAFAQHAAGAYVPLRLDVRHIQDVACVIAKNPPERDIRFGDEPHEERGSHIAHRRGYITRGYAGSARHLSGRGD